MSISTQTSKIFTAGSAFGSAVQVTSIPNVVSVMIPITGTGTARVKYNTAPTSNEDGEPVVGGGNPCVLKHSVGGGITSVFVWVDTASSGATLTGVIQVIDDGKNST